MADRRSRTSVDRARLAQECMESGQEKFFRTYRPRLVRFLTSRANSVAWAEDAADDAMVAVMDNWDRLLTHPRPDSWLFKVALRKLRHMEAHARDLCYLDEDPASSRNDLLSAAAADHWVADHLDLITAMRSLPRRQLEVVGLHFFGEYTLAETAQILSIDIGTVKKHKSRGLENLRKHDAFKGVPIRARRISA